PLTKRMSGYLLFQFGLLFLLHSILFLSNKPRTESYFTFTEIFSIIREPGSSEFFGGGVFGQLLFAFSSTGISLIGTLLLSMIFIYFSILMITHKNIADTLTAHTNKTVNAFRTIGLGIVKLFARLYKSIANGAGNIIDSRKKTAAEGGTDN